MKLVNTQGQPDTFNIPGGLVATIQWNWFERIFAGAKETKYYSRFGILWYYKTRNGRSARTGFWSFTHGIDKLLDNITEEFQNKEGTEVISMTMKNLQSKGLTLIK